ncbi:MAG TPA: aminoacyl-tRNA hydrolase [Planctomycetota bacterium]|nr:aminoacyl-tRNA hydrolase [Planctomycetota bacterium]
MTWKRIVLGIGNPGAEYDGTRHNIGFAVADAVAARAGLSWHRLERKDAAGNKLFSGKVKATVAEGSASGEPYLLVKPLTYVNLSGDVAGPLLRHAHLTPEHLLVVVDDLNLPLGKLRLRAAGSAGGHNGLRSIEAALQSQAYPRLRIGIGAPEGGFVEHVLDRFGEDEIPIVQQAVARAAEAVAGWLARTPLNRLMDVYNREPDPA